MRKKTDEIEDKAVKPAQHRKRQPVSAPPAPIESDALTATIETERATIEMRSGRGWTLGDRTLKAGETATLDAETAAVIVRAGYADYV